MHIPLFQRPTRGGLAALALATAALAGCAGNPPKEQFTVTEAAIQNAMVAQATLYAPIEMQAAREKWREAEMEMQRKHYDKARALAQKAEFDARLAERKARAMKEQKELQRAQEGIRILREESLRNL